MSTCLHKCVYLCTGWFVAPEESNSDDVVVCRLDEGSTGVLYALRITEGFSWSFSLRGLRLNCSICPILATFPGTLTSASDVCDVSSELSSFRVCMGNCDEKFLELSRLRKGQFMDASGKIFFSMHVQSFI